MNLVHVLRLFTIVKFHRPNCEGGAYCQSRMALQSDFVWEELEFKTIGDTEKKTAVYPLVYGRDSAPSMDV